ncbi:MAG: beta-propeller domain-containing protein [Myxococcota bacterium]
MKRNRSRSRLGRPLVLAGAVALAACETSVDVTNQPIQEQPALMPITSCDQLETHIEDSAVLTMRTYLESMKRWNAYYATTRSSGGEESTTAESDSAGMASSAGNSGPGAYTQTNTQVRGVDEADFVKNDGTRIFVLSGGKLIINRSWPAQELQTTAVLDVEGWPQEMFLDEQDRVVIFSTVWSERADDPHKPQCLSLECGMYYANTTKVTVVDVSELTAPRVLNEVYVPGLYHQARRVGPAVRMVLRDHFRWPESIQWGLEGPAFLLPENIRSRLYDDLMARNERIIRDQTLSHWLPAARRVTPTGETVELGHECTEFTRSNATVNWGILTVATLNLDAPESGLHRSSVVAQPDEVYANTESLYVTNRHWWFFPEPGQRQHTYVHKFDITDPTRATYVASGGLDGFVVDQFSLDESNGFLRAAVTSFFADSDNRFTTTNRVTVLKQDGTRLVVAGQTDEVAPGERIFSARFLGNRGFLVTFRQVDPLFTVDLSDPAQPRIVGELKVPGVSTYIHPIDENHLLTIGMDISAETNRRNGMKLTIFDVTDFAQPRESFTHLLGDLSSWTEAAFEHKAFNYFPERKQLAIPLADWDFGSGWSTFDSKLVVLGVDVETGFTEKGSVRVSDLFERTGNSRWSFFWTPTVRRSVMADDMVYAISDAGIRVAHVDNLASPVATVSFPAPEE